MKRLALCLAGVMGLLVSGCAVDQSQTSYGAMNGGPDFESQAMVDDMFERTTTGADVPAQTSCTGDFGAEIRSFETARSADAIKRRRLNIECEPFTINGAMGARPATPPQ